ncbi:hypothetical protein F5Y14DRAFT_426785, partial [Nemania sp. NC0429]
MRLCPIKELRRLKPVLLLMVLELLASGLVRLTFRISHSTQSVLPLQPAAYLLPYTRYRHLHFYLLPIPPWWERM